MDSLSLSSFKQAAIAIFVVFVFGMSAFEIFSELMDGEAFVSMSDDMLRFCVSLLILGIFAYEYRKQQIALGELKEKLERTKGQFSNLNKKTVEIASQYRAIMQEQFDEWELTDSEQEVVIGMLKGLSFREIAELRETREKTVRQQASNVYKKAKVNTRYELAAWFFEDMLEPPSLK
ncbi:helix-turn-helix transcriptional regulator [Curvivirga aplysinae]|uniref:helix-turn-helix transcriptional regulator n=1 Tax=Curvivirga aplysinae TaxID=2529852 RepID=UPI0012BD3DC9|nr:LuxR C-terminal-related transcriptional regulator [Curvivirga aplysinae]MTI08446.1 response regulator transcription factor [Curvivirga aplysinae]